MREAYEGEGIEGKGSGDSTGVEREEHTEGKGSAGSHMAGGEVRVG